GMRRGRRRPVFSAISLGLQSGTPIASAHQGDGWMFCHHHRDYRHHWRSDFTNWEQQLRRFQREWQRRVDLAQSAHPRTPHKSAARRAAAAVGFWVLFMCYVSVIGLLALINLLTSPFTPWFLWPAFGWGIGVFSHYMAVFGRRVIKERFFDPM